MNLNLYRGKCGYLNRLNSLHNIRVALGVWSLWWRFECTDQIDAASCSELVGAYADFIALRDYHHQRNQASRLIFIE